MRWRRGVEESEVLPQDIVEQFAPSSRGHPLTCHIITALLRLYYGSTKALLRPYYGPIKALLGLYKGSIKALLASSRRHALVCELRQSANSER